VHLVSHKDQGQYRAFLSAAAKINPAVRIVGLTATPFRTGSGSIMHGDDALFHDVAYEVGMLELIQKGYLAPLVSKRMATQVDLSEVQTRNGEFVPGQLERAMDKEAITAAALDEVEQYGAERKRWLVFCAGVKHAEHVAEALNARGIKAGCVTGKTPARERDQLIALYRAGTLRALTNANVLTVGFDAPETDLLVMLRPTQSPGLYVQMAGRGSRIAPGKADCLILDFAGNAMRHGPVDQIKAWRPAPPSGGPAPFKTCPTCETVCATAVRQCPTCGYQFPFDEHAKHAAHASEAPILSTDVAPIIERHAVHSVECRHWPSRSGGPDTLRVDYRGPFMRIASEWVCLEHQGYARAKAVTWWLRRAPGSVVPKSVEEAAARAHELRHPAFIEVNTRPKFPEIVGYDWNDHEPGAEGPRPGHPDSGPEHRPGPA
jgi:DNA repair protein RadD